jgi:hypothetical protein
MEWIWNFYYLIIVMATQTLTTADSSPWATPAGAYNLVIECWGAGGGGGGANSGIDGGAGGGGGGAYSKLTVAAPSGNYNFAVGAGGAGGSGNVNGSAGADTWFVSNDASGCVAKGGSGGYRQSGASPDARGGTGGLASAGYGDVKYDGGYGEYGRTGSVNGYGGYGGSSAGTGADGVGDGAYPAYSTPTFPAGTEPAGAGVGGDGGGLAANGNSPASGYGGGGGGSGDATPGTGGTGANGKIVLTWDVASGDVTVNCSVASLSLTVYNATLLAPLTIFASCASLTLTGRTANINAEISFTTSVRALILEAFEAEVRDGRILVYKDWRDNKGLGPWEFTEQGDKWGYLNNPRWQKSPTKAINYSEDRSAEPQVWNLPGEGRKYSAGEGALHIPCGHWHKVVVPSEARTRKLTPKIYVCDSIRGKTLIWSRNYLFSNEITSYGIAIDIENGEVYTLAGGAPIKVTSLDGTLLRTMGSNGTGDGQWEDARDICVHNGYVYVADVGNKKIIIFTTDGTFVKSFNTYHLLDTQWGEAKGVEVYGSRIYAPVGWRIQIYDLAGNYLGYYIGASGSLGPHTGDSDMWNAYRCQVYEGELYTLNGYDLDSKVIVRSLSGTYTRKFDISNSGTIRGFYIYDDKVYIVYDISVTLVRVYSLTGTLYDEFGVTGGNVGEFTRPRDVCVYP